MNTEQERAEFERHWHDFYQLGTKLARINGRYHSPAVQRAWEAWQARAALQSQPLTVDALAQEIRRVNGDHSLGAGALAEALMPFLESALQSQDAEDAERFRFCLEHGFPQKWEEMIKGNLRHYWTSRPGSQEEFSSAIEAIDHARRVEGERDARALD